MKMADILDANSAKSIKSQQANQFQIKKLKTIIIQYDKSVLIIGK